MGIQIRGAREHNLQGVDAEIGDGLTVVTGVSGSGKTSLVFDTLYHEARRRLLDVISTSRPGGWRHQLAPAQVDSITGLGPAIAVGQNILNRNPLSTLATASGLHPFLRILYATQATRHCPRCEAALSVLSEDQVVERLLGLARRGAVQISAPLMRGVPGSHRTLLELLARELGAEAVWVDGRSYRSLLRDQARGATLAPREAHDVDVSLGWIEEPASAVQVRDLVQQAAALGAQAITARGPGQHSPNEPPDRPHRNAVTPWEHTLATAPVCVECSTWFETLEPTHFHQPCPYCRGKGCRRCDGTGMHPQAAGARWQGLRFPDLLSRTVAEARGLFVAEDGAWGLRSAPGTEGRAAEGGPDRLHREILRRLEALDRVGLGYIALDRPSPTLSRGEAQRVRLAVTLTGRLEDMLHVLDEPTIGQHPADVARLLPAFRELAGPVVFVEHDRLAAATADQAIDLGPGAGAGGGRIVFAGAPAGLWSAATPTGRYFSRREQVRSPQRRPPPERFLTIREARQHNMRGIDVEIPIGRLTVITGVSGSGKSTLVEHVLCPSLKRKSPTGCAALEGPWLRPVLVDQSPIGRNPRSNPATYTKLADILRDLYAGVTGLSASAFSFNRPEGACPTCKGMGAVEVRMQFLHSVWIPCADCDGQRFNEAVLAARVAFGERELSIADFYQLSISEAAALFRGEARLPPGRVRAARRILRALTDVGLGYLPLGQPSPSLSGGEAQRVKLTKYLGRGNLADHLLALDEPSTGLHPQDLDGLLVVLDRLVQAGTTVVVVEHNSDIIRAADWIVDLGPGAGPEGGRVLYAGPPDGIEGVEESVTGRVLLEERLLQPRQATDGVTQSRSGSEDITIRNARANNLKGVDVQIPKGKLTVITGLSGSGKSSLVGDVLEAEARRRYLESLSMYERQGTREGPEAPVDSVSGLGVTLSVGGEQSHLWSTLSHFTRRASVGRATEISHHLAVLMATCGERDCLVCGTRMHRADRWVCPGCGATAPIARPRHFSATHYASACDRCTGVGSLLIPRPDKLIIHPDKPLCGGALYSPGYWPQTYHCQDTGLCQALGHRYRFDPFATPWNEMEEEAQQAYLFGDDEPLEMTYRSKSSGRLVTHTQAWEGFYGGWVRNWDVHGTYTETADCPQCGGAGLRAEYLAVTLAGRTIHDLSQMPLEELVQVLAGLSPEAMAVDRRDDDDGGRSEWPGLVRRSLDTARRRLRFLHKVGLGYLHLNRPSGTLSAGEAQRIQLAGLLGSDLTSLTVLLDEPSRGMHPSELDALRDALQELRDEGNTVIVVEHDLLLIRAADHIIELGPDAGASGGEIVACGTPREVARTDTWTGRWLRNTATKGALRRRRNASSWLVIRGARAHNLRGETIEIPLGQLVGICGVSGSGKSTLLIDTLGRALVQKKHTTSFSHEPLKPGEHDAIEGAPARTVVLDQTRQGIRSPSSFLGLTKPLLELYAASEDAQGLGLDKKQLGRPCTACKGRGVVRIEMGFLPDLLVECETCRGSGYRAEAWGVRLRGRSLPEVNRLTLDEVYELFGDEERIARPLEVARRVGLGYLTWHQAAYTLSGGEAQRLRIAKELSRKSWGNRSASKCLYILDEPTVGQHMEDVRRLVEVLQVLVDAGHTVCLIEHHPHVLAACDWLIELGPGGGPKGGQVVAATTPEWLAEAGTPTSPYLRAVLEGKA